MPPPLNQKFRGANRDYAVNLVHSVCCLAGDPEFFKIRRAGGKSSLAAAIARHDSARLFEWLIEAMSYPSGGRGARWWHRSRLPQAPASRGRCALCKWPVGDLLVDKTHLTV